MGPYKAKQGGFPCLNCRVYSILQIAKLVRGTLSAKVTYEQVIPLPIEPFPTDGHLGGFTVSAISNTAAMNIAGSHPGCTLE